MISMDFLRRDTITLEKDKLISLMKKTRDDYELDLSNDLINEIVTAYIASVFTNKGTNANKFVEKTFGSIASKKIISASNRTISEIEAHFELFSKAIDKNDESDKDEIFSMLNRDINKINRYKEKAGMEPMHPLDFTKRR